MTLLVLVLTVLLQVPVLMLHVPVLMLLHVPVLMLLGRMLLLSVSLSSSSVLAQAQDQEELVDDLVEQVALVALVRVSPREC